MFMREYAVGTAHPESKVPLFRQICLQYALVSVPRSQNLRRYMTQQVLVRNGTYPAERSEKFETHERDANR